MAQPPASPVLATEATRVLPTFAQKTFLANGTVQFPVLASGATMSAAFDLGGKTTDASQFLGGVLAPANNPTGPATIQLAIGPWLDAVWTSDNIGTITVSFATDYFCVFHSVYSVGVVPGVTDNISGLRVTARFVWVLFTNTSLFDANVDFGVYIKSS